MLDIHQDTGQPALREAGLEAEFLAIARREGQDLRLVDTAGEILVDETTADDAPMDRPEVDRADLLVGADGAHSRVRPLLTDVTPLDLGVSTVEFGIPDADRTHPEVAAMVGRGNFWAVGDNQFLSAQRNGDGPGSGSTSRTVVSWTCRPRIRLGSVRLSSNCSMGGIRASTSWSKRATTSWLLGRSRCCRWERAGQPLAR